MANDLLGDDAPRQIRLERLIESTDREVKKRKSAYPRWVQQKKMSQSFANEEIACMEEISNLLRRVQSWRDAVEDGEFHGDDVETAIEEIING